MVADMLGSREVRERGIYNVKTIVNDLERHKRGDVDVHHDLFHLAEFEMIAELLNDKSNADLSEACPTISKTEQGKTVVSAHEVRT